MTTDPDPRFRWAAQRLQRASGPVAILGARHVGLTSLVQAVFPDLMRQDLSNRDAKVSVSPGQFIDRPASKASLQALETGIEAVGNGRMVIGGVPFLSSQIPSLGRCCSQLELWPLMASEILHPDSASPPQPLIHHLITSPGPLTPLVTRFSSTASRDGRERRAAINHLSRFGGLPGVLGLQPADRVRWLSRIEPLDSLAGGILADEGGLARQLLRVLAEASGHVIGPHDLARRLQIRVESVRGLLRAFEAGQLIKIVPPASGDRTDESAQFGVYFVDIGLLRNQLLAWARPFSDSMLQTLVVSEIHKWTRTSGLKVSLTLFMQGRVPIIFINTPSGVIGLQTILRVTRGPKAMSRVAQVLGHRWRGGLLVVSEGEVECLSEELGIWTVPAHDLF